jgi:hypothetical protein
LKIKIKIKRQSQGNIKSLESGVVVDLPLLVIPANGGIHLDLDLALLLLPGPVVGAEQRSRASGKGATV